MTPHGTRILAHLLALGCVALAGCADRAASAPDLVVAGACPDGADLLVTFHAADGELQAQACCGHPGDGAGMRKAERGDGVPDPLGESASMRKDQGEPGPRPEPALDRMRADPRDDPTPGPGRLGTAAY
jgi:hypothetical protein